MPATPLCLGLPRIHVHNLLAGDGRSGAGTTRPAFELGRAEDGARLHVRADAVDRIAVLAQQRIYHDGPTVDGVTTLHELRRELLTEYTLHFVLRRSVYLKNSRIEDGEDTELDPPVYVYVHNAEDETREDRTSSVPTTLMIKGRSLDLSPQSPQHHVELNRSDPRSHGARQCAFCARCHIRHVPFVVPTPKATLRRFVRGQATMVVDGTHAFFDPRRHCEWAAHLPSLWVLSAVGDTVTAAHRDGTGRCDPWPSEAAAVLPRLIEEEGTPGITYGRLRRLDPGLARRVACDYLGAVG